MCYHKVFQQDYFLSFDLLRQIHKPNPSSSWYDIVERSSDNIRVNHGTLSVGLTVHFI